MIEIKDWFFTNMCVEFSQYGYQIMGYEVVGETEKAYKLSVDAVRVDGEKEITRIQWCPKSCVKTAEEIQEEQNRFENGCRRYEAALKFAKENGLKVRNKMKLKNILSKIKEAGLEFNY